MSTEQRLGCDIERFFECADQLRSLQDRVGDSRQAARGPREDSPLFSAAPERAAVSPDKSRITSHSVRPPSLARSKSKRPRPAGFTCCNASILSWNWPKPLSARLICPRIIVLTGIRGIAIVGQKHRYTQDRRQFFSRVKRDVRWADDQAKTFGNDIHGLFQPVRLAWPRPRGRPFWVVSSGGHRTIQPCP